MRDLIKNRPILLVWYFIMCVVLSTAPFYFWKLPIYIFILGCFFLFPLWKRSFSPLELAPLFFIFLFFVFSSFYRYDKSNVFGKLFMFIPFMLYFIDGNVWKYVYKSFVKIYAIALIPSLIVYFLVTWLEIDIPSKTIQPLNSLKMVYYESYYFMVNANTGIPWDLYRFCAYFDEPGVVGTISGVLLLVNKIDLRKWYNWPILLSGIFSFSLFFYALLVIYFIIWGRFWGRVTVIALILVAVLYVSLMDDSVVNNLILSRLELEDGWFSGDNRTVTGFDSFYANFVRSDRLWFGYGGGYSAEVVDVGGFSYKDLIVDYGIILFISYVVGMVLLLWDKCKKSKNFLLAIILFAAIMYQRPMVSSILGVFLFLAPCYGVEPALTKNEK